MRMTLKRKEVEFLDICISYNLQYIVGSRPLAYVCVLDFLPVYIYISICIYIYVGRPSLESGLGLT